MQKTANDKLFAVMIQLGKKAHGNRDFASAAAHYRAAVETAPDASSRVAAWNQLAAIELDRNKPAMAVAALQSILDDPALAMARSDGTQPAGRVASNEIATLIRQHGRAVYAPFDEQAKRGIQTAMETGDADRVELLLAQYPNSRSESQWFLQIANRQWQQGNTQAAIRNYKRLLSQPTTAQLRVSALSRLAAAFETLGYWNLAADRWKQLAAEFPESMVPSERTELTVAEFVASRLSGEHATGKPRHVGNPRPSLPLWRRWEGMLPEFNSERAELASTKTASNAQTIGTETPDMRTVERQVAFIKRAIVPAGTPPSPNLECILCNGPRLKCLNRSDGHIRWERSLDAPLLWAAYADHQLLLGTSRSSTAVIPESGAAIWQRVGINDSFLQNGAKLQVESKPFAIRNDVLIQRVAENRFVASNCNDGSTLWQFQPMAGQLQQHWLCTSRHVVLQSLRPNRIIVLDLYDGGLVHARPGDSAAWPRAPVAVGDDWIALVTADRVVRGLSLEQNALSRAREVRVSALENRFPRGRTRRTFSKVALADAADDWIYAGPMSYANADPELLSNGTRLLLCVDGDTLHELDVKNGSVNWSRSLGRSPVCGIRDLCCIDLEHVYTVCDGIMRCFSLADGKRMWETWLGSQRGRFRVRKLGDKTLAAVPIDTDGAAHGALSLCDADTGRLLQKFRFDRTEFPIQFVAGDEQCLVIAANRLIGVGALPTDPSDFAVFPARRFPSAR